MTFQTQMPEQGGQRGVDHEDQESQTHLDHYCQESLLDAASMP